MKNTKPDYMYTSLWEVSLHLEQAENIIDSKFGPGYAKNNPSLLGNFLLAATFFEALENHAANLCSGLHEIYACSVPQR